MKNRHVNAIFSGLTAVVAVAISILFFVSQYYLIATAFGILAIIFGYVCYSNLLNIKNYVNQYNLLPLAKSLPSKKSQDTSVVGGNVDEKQVLRERLRANLLSNGFKLAEGFYVCQNKNYDVYFSTYTKDNVMTKVEKISTKFNKDKDYIADVVRDCGFTHCPVDINEVSQRIVGAMRYYDNKPELLSHQKSKYFIFVGLDDDNPNPKPMFAFWMFPYNTEHTIDYLSFVDVSVKTGYARLDTMQFNRQPNLRKEIKKIFRGVLDFDATINAEKASELNKHD